MAKEYLDKKGLKLYEDKNKRRFKILKSQWDDIKTAVNDSSIKQTIVAEVIAARTNNKGEKSKALDERLFKLDGEIEKSRDGKNISYDPIGTELESDNIQDAISEIANASIKNIPQANEITFGGVKASPKTDEETQEVKIDTETGFLYVKPSSGGGGGGGIPDSIVKLKTLTPTSLVLAEGVDCILKYNYSSVDSEGVETGDATAVYYVNGVVAETTTIKQGDNSYNPTKLLISGDNSVRVKVTDVYGTSKSLIYQIKVVTLNLTSNFNDTQIYTGDIDIRYTPVGNIEKNVIFKIDGIEIAREVTSITGRQMSKVIPKQNHGSHILEIYMEATMGTQVMKSNVLKYSFISIDEESLTPIISIKYFNTEATQFNTINIPFMVYTPNKYSSDITLWINDRQVSQRNVDRTEQVWSINLQNSGEHIFKIKTGDIEKSITVNVEEVQLDISAETENLSLYLTANNKSNSDIDKDRWEFKNISATMSGFNYITDGWLINNNGDTILRVPEYANVDIPYKIFSNDFKSTGKTIEVEFSTSNIDNYDAVLISCMNNNKGIEITAQKAIFKSELSSVETQFKEEEKVRVSFVVESLNQDKLILTYINGIMSGVVQYPNNDSFTQTNPVNITIGGAGATIDISNIRIYNADLNQYQILNNYMADMSNLDKKMEISNRNKIFDDYGNIVYGKVLEQIPCMTIIGDLPQYKGDKKKVGVVYEDNQNPTNSFTSTEVSINVQGTSSQYYPRKNYKLKFKKFIKNDESEEEGYCLRETSVPANVFCTKADFAESSGTHNTGMAKIADRYLKALNFLTPPQKENINIRTTVDGFPIVIFHKETEESQPTFLGKYNFNIDKAAQDVFGFSELNECWEFLNNTSERTLFKTSEYEKLDDEGNPEWLNDFEARYPEDSTDYTNFKILTDWIVSTKDNPSKFKEECKQHFNIDFLLFYYIFTEVFGMVDQRAKNMFLATWGNEGEGECKWYPILYDNDTCLGLNNEGKNVFDYKIEYHDVIGTQNVWNGEGSVLWKNVEEAFSEKIEKLYHEMRINDILDYDNVLEVLNKEQSEKWCESIYNADGKFKYIDPMKSEGNAEYLADAQGSREEHRKWWLYNRFNYMDSKYMIGDYKNDFATMRIYNPTNPPIAPNFDFNITPYADQYLRVKYGSVTVKKRGDRNITTKIIAPSGNYNDTETIIYGASKIKDIGDLSLKYAGTIDVSQATKLVSLKIGSDAYGYTNTNLESVKVGNNLMLKMVDVRNCPNLTQSLDLSGCTNIEEVYSDGSGITSVVLPKASNLKKITLPSTITNLTLRNTSISRDNVKLNGLSNINTLILENLPNIDILSLYNEVANTPDSKLERIRLIGIKGYGGSDETILNKLSLMKGIDENGLETPHGVISGNIHVDSIPEKAIEYYKKIFPELNITYNNIEEEFVFADEEVQRVMVENLSNGKGYFTLETVKHINDLKCVFKGNKLITTFDEIGILPINILNESEFEGCVNLSSIKINDNFTADIPNNCFYNCNNLDPNMVTQRIKSSVIGDYAFYNCKSVKTIYLNSNFNEIGSSFANNYKNLVVQNLNKVLKIKEDSIDFDSKRLFVNYRMYKTYKEEPSFKRYVKNINLYDNLSEGTPPKISTPEYDSYWYKDIDFIEEVTYINDNGIYYCKLLWGEMTEIIRLKVIPDSNFKVDLGFSCNKDNKFEIYWDSDNPFVFETQDNYSGDREYYRFSHIYTDNNEKELYIKSFKVMQLDSSCSSDSSNIPNFGFSNGVIKEYVYIDTDKCYPKMYRSLFLKEKNLIKIPYELFKYNKNVTDISYCFHGCTLIKSIKRDIFSYFPNLTEINYCFSDSGITSIPDNLINGLNNLTSMDYCFSDSGITSIPDNLINGLNNLTSMDYCFYNTQIEVLDNIIIRDCKNLESIISLFGNCRNLIKVSGDVIFNCNKIKKGKSLFETCYALKEIEGNIFDNFTNVVDSDYAKDIFANCRELTSVNLGNLKFLSGAVIEFKEIKSSYNGVIETKYGNFKGTNLITIDVPESVVESYKNDIFWGKHKNKINLPDYHPCIEFKINVTSLEKVGYFYLNNADPYSIKIDWGDNKGLMEYPGHFKSLAYEHQYSEVGEHLIKIYSRHPLNISGEFYQNSKKYYNLFSLLNFDINNVEIIDVDGNLKCVFANCNNLTEIPNDLFRNCKNITNINTLFHNCNNLTTVPQDLFEGCNDIVDASSCFENCIKLKNCILLNNKSNLTTVENCYASSGVTSIPENFLTELPENCIDKFVFKNCINLNNVSIKLKNKLSDQFSNCSNLSKLAITNDTLMPLESSSYLNNKVMIYVPDNLLESYKAATNWLTLANRIKPMSEYTEG